MGKASEEEIKVLEGGKKEGEGGKAPLPLALRRQKSTHSKPKKR